MNLKAQYNRLFKNSKTINEALYLGIATGKKVAPINEELTAEDYGYFVDKLDEILKQVNDLHEEMGTQISLAYDETQLPKYDQQEKQVGRYIGSVTAAIENLKKYLKRQ